MQRIKTAIANRLPTLSYCSAPLIPAAAEEHLRRAQKFEAQAGAAMCEGKLAIYEHNKAQAEAAWSHYRKELNQEN